MRRDTIFRIASVTKPIVAAAAMILDEEGTLRLDDPVDPLLPELANRQVLRTIESPLDDTVPANRPITLRDLLTFRLGYGAIFAAPGQYPIQAALEEAGFAAGPGLPTVPPDELMERYGNLPLLHQPGEKWLYNTGSDILGVLIARATDMTLGEFLASGIFDPLGMKDTAFSVPASKRDHVPAAYWTNFESGEFEVFDPTQESRWASPPAFDSGASGLVSTVDDLFAFAQMMLGNGNSGTSAFFRAPAVTLMTTDQITPEQKAASASDFFPGILGQQRLGIRVAINTRRDNLATTPGRYGWDGGYGTSWYVDPAGGADRHPLDSARLGRCRSASHIRFLDVGLSGPSTTETPAYLGERTVAMLTVHSPGSGVLYGDGLTKEHLCCTFIVQPVYSPAHSGAGAARLRG